MTYWKTNLFLATILILERFKYTIMIKNYPYKGENLGGETEIEAA